MSALWESDNYEELSTIRGGSGWIGEPEALAKLPLSERTGVQILREGVREQRAAERERADRADWAEGRALWLEREGRVRTQAEVLSGFAWAADRADRQEERDLRQRLQATDGYVAPPSAPTLRGEQFEMRRRHQERLASRTPEQAQIDELRQELTRLRGKLAAGR